MARMGHLIAVAAALWAAGLATASAQQRPDFSGEWTRAADSIMAGRPSTAATGDASFRRGDMGSGWGASITITQRADSLAVQYVYFSTYDLQPRLRLAYALDGSESRNSVMIGHATSEQRSRVSWNGGSLVITTMYPAPSSGDGRAAVAEVRQTLTLESPTSLVVETTRMGIRGAPTNTTKSVYTKR